MFKHSDFRDDVYKDAIDITGKKYSDYGMMWNELSKNTGISKSILERYDDWYIYFSGDCFHDYSYSDRTSGCSYGVKYRGIPGYYV